MILPSAAFYFLRGIRNILDLPKQKQLPTDKFFNVKTKVKHNIHYMLLSNKLEHKRSYQMGTYSS